MADPPTIVTFDLSVSDGLMNACVAYIDYIDDRLNFCEEKLDDYQYKIFEQAMFLVFGDKVFDWINKNIK